MSPTHEEDDAEMSKKYNFPKVELHCHLDGCYRVQTIAEIARHRDVPLPSYDAEVLRGHITTTGRCGSLEDYLDKIAITVNAYAGDADAIRRITREAIEDKSKDGLTYLELRYSPHYFSNCDVEPMVHAKERGRLRPKDVVEVVNKAVKEYGEEFGVKVRTILCGIIPYDWGREVAQLCREYSHQGVVAIDIAGPESSADFSAHCRQSYEYCKMEGVHRTAHAGEVGPGDRVRQAIEHLHVERIGHGYQVVHDENAYRTAKDHRTHFEVCPLSSHGTGAASEDWSEHAAKKFLADDVNFSLSSDDPGVHDVGLLGDYDIATKEWGFTIKDLHKLNLNAAECCFLDGAERQELISDLKKAYQAFNDNNLEEKS